MSRLPRNSNQTGFAADLPRDNTTQHYEWASRQLVTYLQAENAELRQRISQLGQNLHAINTSNACLQTQQQRLYQYIAQYNEITKILAQSLDKIIVAAPPELRPESRLEDLVNDLMEKRASVANLEAVNLEQEKQIDRQQKYIEQLERSRNSQDSVKLPPIGPLG